MSTPIFDSIRAERERVDAGHVVDRHHPHGDLFVPRSPAELRRVIAQEQAELKVKDARRHLWAAISVCTVVVFAGVLLVSWSAWTMTPFNGAHLLGIAGIALGGWGVYVGAARLRELPTGDSEGVLGLEDVEAGEDQ